MAAVQCGEAGFPGGVLHAGGAIFADLVEYASWMASIGPCPGRQLCLWVEKAFCFEGSQRGGIQSPQKIPLGGAAAGLLSSTRKGSIRFIIRK